jgi:hypothetical protein
MACSWCVRFGVQAQVAQRERLAEEMKRHQSTYNKDAEEKRRQERLKEIERRKEV